jgi:hypothetical protein
MDGGECPLWVKTGHRTGSSVMSALHLKADIRQRAGHVRFVPIVDLLEHTALARGTVTEPLGRTVYFPWACAIWPTSLAQSISIAP